MGITRTEREQAWVEGLQNLFATVDFAHQNQRLPEAHEPLCLHSRPEDEDDFVAWVLQQGKGSERRNDLELAREALSLRALTSGKMRCRKI